MAQKLKSSAFPDSVFDFPIIGMNLTRADVEEISKNWTPDQMKKFGEAFPHLVEEEAPKKVEATKSEK